MKIAVCAKVVPESGSRRRIDTQTKRLDRSGEIGLNSFDVNAVEEALRIKERVPDSEVVVVSLGPARALEALRKALAMGADRLVLISDDAAEGSDLVATSTVLAKALERENAELVLFGQQAGDSDGAQVAAGEPVGFVGDSGDANGMHPHLHFEVHPERGAATDPFRYLNRAQHLLFRSGSPARAISPAGA